MKREDSRSCDRPEKGHIRLLVDKLREGGISRVLDQLDFPRGRSETRVGSQE